MKPWNVKIKLCCFSEFGEHGTKKGTSVPLPPPNLKDVPWLRRLVVGISPRRPGTRVWAGPCGICG